MKLSDFLATLDFISTRKSSEYVGTKLHNPAMVLEENIHIWTKTTDLEDIQKAFEVFESRVCLQGFPTRYSPQFWLAHAALTAIYKVMW